MNNMNIICMVPDLDDVKNTGLYKRIKSLLGNLLVRDITTRSVRLEFKGGTVWFITKRQPPMTIAGLNIHIVIIADEKIGAEWYDLLKKRLMVTEGFMLSLVTSSRPHHDKDSDDYYRGGLNACDVIDKVFEMHDKAIPLSVETVFDIVRGIRRQFNKVNAT